MAKVLNYESEIITGGTIEPQHIKQSVDAFTGADAYDISISGSLEVTGSVTIGSTNTTTKTYSATIAGVDNNNCGYRSVILGGCCNIITENSSSGIDGQSIIAGGHCNEIDSIRGYHSIVGGYSNFISSSNGRFGYSNSIIGGNRNHICVGGDANVIVGGKESCIQGGEIVSIIAGGASNVVTGHISAIIGGALNTIGGQGSGIIGYNNTVNDDYSYAFGRDITTNKDCTAFVNNLSITGSITSNGVLNLSLRVTTPSPLSAGDIWRSGSSSDNSLYFSPNGSAICQIAFV